MSERSELDKKTPGPPKASSPKVTLSKPTSSKSTSRMPEGTPSFEKLNPAVEDPYMLVAMGPGTSHCVRGPKTWQAKGLWQAKGEKKEDFTKVIEKLKGIPRCASFGEKGTWYVLYEYPKHDRASGKTVLKAIDQG